MALACKQDNVRWAGVIEGRRDRVAAVRDQQQIFAATASGRFSTRRDLINDRDGVLPPRILIGRDDEPAAFSSDVTLQGPLPNVALASRAEDCDETASGPHERAERVEDSSEGSRGVGVVDHYGVRLAAGDALHSSGNSGEPGQPRQYGVWIEVQHLAKRDDGEGVVHIEAA